MPLCTFGGRKPIQPREKRDAGPEVLGKGKFAGQEDLIEGRSFD